METLILNSNSRKDVILLIDIAKKIGLDLRIATKKDLILAEAKLLDASVKPNKITTQEIVEENWAVRKFFYKKRILCCFVWINKY